MLALVLNKEDCLKTFFFQKQSHLKDKDINILKLSENKKKKINFFFFFFFLFFFFFNFFKNFFFSLQNNLDNYEERLSNYLDGNYCFNKKKLVHFFF